MNSNLDALFNKIYVLTIDRNYDRHPSVQKILEGMDFEFWYGFDTNRVFPDKKFVSDLPDVFFSKNNIDKEHVSWWTKGQLGAYFSIKNMIKHVAKSDYKQVLIFEDDFMPVEKKWPKKVFKAIEELPIDWDVLLLGYLYRGPSYKYAYYRSMRGIIKAWNYLKCFFKKENVAVLPEKFSKNLDKSGVCTGGHAYCLSRKGAIYLSEFLDPMKESGDNLINKLIIEKKINAYSIYPCLFLQNSKFDSKTEVS